VLIVPPLQTFAFPSVLPTNGELAILTVLWTIQRGTVREVHNALNRRTGYTTVLKQMQVMVAKGLLVRSELHRSHIYEVRFTERETQQQLIQSLQTRAFNGSTTSLVCSTLSSLRLSRTELAEIRLAKSDAALELLQAIRTVRDGGRYVSQRLMSRGLTLDI
jgi:predicted transcriptional regulator